MKILADNDLEISSQASPQVTQAPNVTQFIFSYFLTRAIFYEGISRALDHIHRIHLHRKFLADIQSSHNAFVSSLSVEAHNAVQHELLVKNSGSMDTEQQDIGKRA